MLTIFRILLLCACLSLTAVASVMSLRNLSDRAESQFTTMVGDAQLVFRSRLNAYVHSLDSAAAFVASVPDLDSAAWRNFVELIDIKKNLAGVSALGLVRAVPEAQLDDFAAQRRRDGLPFFAIHPEVKAAEHMVIAFMEPLAGNEEALGLDLTFDPARVGVLQASRNSDEKLLSPPLRLVQYPDSPGFVFTRAVHGYVPTDAVPGPDSPRTLGHQGWVVAPFIGATALANLTAQQHDRFGLAVYDLSDGSDEMLIYDHREYEEAHKPRFTVTLSEPMFGRNWSMRFTSTPSFEASVDSYAPVIVLATGLFTTGLLALLLEILIRRVNTVNSLVASRTKQLKARVNENKSIVDSAFVPILILNEKDEIIQANPAALSLVGGKTLAELKRRHIGDFVTPTTSADLSVRSGFGGWTHTGADGRLLNVRRSSWSAEDGNLRHSLIIQDVTEEAAAARRITEAEERWHIALNGADIGVFDINLETGKSIVSETWKRLMQVDAESAEYEPQADFLSRIHKEDFIRLQEADRRCIEGESNRSICEYRLLDRSGNWRWMRSDAAVAERSKDGKALRLVGAQMDVTDLRMAREAVETSRKRFQLVISEAPVGMAVLDKEGYFTSVNDALCQFLGYHEDEMIGTVRISDLLDKEALKKVISIVGPQAEDRAGSYQAEHEWIARDGSKIWALLSIAWTFDPETQSDIYIAQLCDITEKKHIERMKSEFVATVSHELRTPLTSIKGALSLLQSSLQNPQSQTLRLLEIAQRNSERLGALVNDILDLEKLSSDKDGFDIAEHSLRSVILDAATLIETMAEKNSVSIKLDLPEEPMMAMIDPARTHQVLANLLSNACKFSYPSGEVQVRSEILNDYIIVYVCDNGRGIPASFRSQLFKPFVQADNSDTRQFDGTGLGLHIARQIVDSMGGRIGFTSEPDKLTVFWFTVPLAATQPADTPRSKAAQG